MKYISIFLCIFAMLAMVSCSGESEANPSAKPPVAQKGGKQAPAEKAQPEKKAAPAEKAESLGHIKAKANEKTAEIEFDVQTAVLANFFNQFNIALSDMANDPVSDSGQFPPSEDENAQYHRVVLKFQEVPTAPGTYPLKGFVYSVKDADMHFNFGWSGDSLTGTVTLDTVEGELPEVPGGIKARPAKVSGSFEATNTYGGVFSGKFTAAGQVPESK